MHSGAARNERVLRLGRRQEAGESSGGLPWGRKTEDRSLLSLLQPWWCCPPIFSPRKPQPSPPYCLFLYLSYSDWNASEHTCLDLSAHPSNVCTKDSCVPVSWMATETPGHLSSIVCPGILQRQPLSILWLFVPFSSTTCYELWRRVTFQSFSFPPSQCAELAEIIQQLCIELNRSQASEDLQSIVFVLQLSGF